MGEELPPPVEIVDLEDGVPSASAAADRARVHAWLRTAAVLVAALSLVWIGLSAAGMRAESERQTCFTELQMAIWPAPGLPEEEIGDRFVERAEECGLPLLAESIRRNYDGD